MENLEHLSSEAISQKIDEKEKELSGALKVAYLVEQERFSLQKDILEKQIKKKDIDIALSKANHIVKQLNIELKIMRSVYWKTRDEKR